ncbi:hypothetical protein VTK26DRAFT_2111 [Humicola hyalothermophila]
MKANTIKKNWFTACQSTAFLFGRKPGSLRHARTSDSAPSSYGQPGHTGEPCMTNDLQNHQYPCTECQHHIVRGGARRFMDGPTLSESPALTQ